jgi:hypothetical protein
MSNKVDPTSSYATASIAFEVFNAHKSTHYDTVGITPREQYLEEAD